MEKDWSKDCILCKWILQGKNGMSCGNLEQNNKEYKEFVSSGFSCDLFNNDKKLTKKEWENLGYVQKVQTIKFANGRKENYLYYVRNI